jgi:hypothetical protein
MKTVKILLAASLLALALGKVSAQVNIGSVQQSVGATTPGDPLGTGEGF